MSAEKKVLFLFIALIVLIVLCVLTHLPKLVPNQDGLVSQVNQTQNIETKDEEVEEEKKIEEVKTKVVVEEKIETNSNNSEIEVTAKKDEELQEEIVEEKIEEVKQDPLIYTDARYIRQDDEKNIEELSISSQELQIKINAYLKENPIFFERASYNTTRGSESTIRKVVEILELNPTLKIEVAGHTDSAGAAKLNQAISLKRAKSVRDNLVNHYGISANRVIPRGYGEEIPLVKNSPKGYSRINRRVEFNILGE